MKKLTALILTASAFFFSCQNERQTIKREGEPDIIQASNDDIELNRAIAYAKAHYYQFLHAAYDDDTTKHDFRVKISFPSTDGGNEHIWLSDLTASHDSVFGYVSNVPRAVPNLKLGQEVYVDTSVLSDWYYIKDHKLVGGWTIKVLLKNAGKEEIEKVEKEMDCKIDFRE